MYCTTKDGEWHGEYIDWYQDGSLSTQGYYHLGEKHGSWIDRWSDGSMRVSHWDRGKQVGTWHQYYPEGTLQLIETYFDGTRSGLKRSWNEDGQLIREEFYRAGERVGRWRSWNEDGTLIHEMDWNEHRDERLSISRTRHGGVSWVLPYYKGQPHGVGLDYNNRSGQLEAVYRYRHGKMLWRHRLGQVRARIQVSSPGASPSP